MCGLLNAARVRICWEAEQQRHKYVSIVRCTTDRLIYNKTLLIIRNQN